MSIRTPFRNALLLAALAIPGGARAEEPTAPSAAQDDPAKAQIRQRFRLGMEKYQEGAYREAIGFWDGIYRELGPREGYRVSFNLARAYEKFQDFTLAAERYEAFLVETELRRQEGHPLEAIVEREEREAQDRLAELRAEKGRVRVVPGRVPLEAKLDDTERRPAGFVAYVAPGEHTVVLLRGSEVVAKKQVTVAAGQIVEVEPPSIPEPPRPEPLRTVHERSRPYSPVVLYAAGAVTAVSVLVPVFTYAHALSVKSQRDGQLDAGGGTSAGQIAGVRGMEDDYLTARTTAYATLAIPLALAAITGGLTAWYFLGTKEHEVVVRPAVTQGGMVMGATGRF